jgi:D-aspartate ligase
MKAIGYQGILDIGYRYDRRDGRYKVLDVNPRIGCTFRLFTSIDGIDVARTLYRDMAGEPITSGGFPEGRKWIVEDFDLFSALSSWHEGTITFKDWMNSMRGVQEAACFALDDPLPFLLMWVEDCIGLYQWIRGQLGAQKPEPSNSPEALAPSDFHR